jgi:hypothetical protein
MIMRVNKQLHAEYAKFLDANVIFRFEFEHRHRIMYSDLDGKKILDTVLTEEMAKRMRKCEVAINS